MSSVDTDIKLNRYFLLEVPIMFLGEKLASYQTKSVCQDIEMPPLLSTTQRLRANCFHSASVNEVFWLLKVSCLLRGLQFDSRCHLFFRDKRLRFQPMSERRYMCGSADRVSM